MKLVDFTITALILIAVYGVVVTEAKALTQPEPDLRTPEKVHEYSDNMVSQEKQKYYMDVVNKEALKLLPYSPVLKTVTTKFKYASKDRYGNTVITIAAADCRGAHLNLYFDEYLVFLMFDKGDNQSGPIIAHEMSHCAIDDDKDWSVKGIVNQESGVELEADRLGLDLYKAAGGSADFYIDSYKLLDYPVSDSHPSDAYRSKYLRNYLKTGETKPKKYGEYK